MPKAKKKPDAATRHRAHLTTVIRELEKAAKCADSQAKTYKDYPEIKQNWSSLAKEHRELVKRFRVRYGIHKKKAKS